MTHTPSAFIRPFDQAEPYEQDEPGDARFSWLLKRNELPGLAIGRVRLTGPIHKTPAAHGEWEQVYLILKGTATVHLPDSRHRVEAPSVVVIPRHTLHSVELTANETLEYAFINQYHHG